MFDGNDTAFSNMDEVHPDDKKRINANVQIKEVDTESA